MSGIALASKTWGGDYDKFLAGAFSAKRRDFDGIMLYSFLVVNNGVPEGVEFPMRTVLAEKWRHSILDPFDLAVANHYALGELAAIWHASSSGVKYLCFIQGDCLTQGGDWISPGIDYLVSEPDVMVVSPASEVNTWHDKDGYDHYMSDQAWLVRVQDFLNPEVYHVPGIDPDYPDYGGNSFEHMVGKYLKKTGKKRKILTDFYVLHPAY